MAKLHFDFVKDAKQGIIELEVFTRLLQGDIYDYEELRIERPSNYGAGFEYIGVAPSGSSIYDPIWSCVRCTWINNRKVRIQIRANVVWNDKSHGWS